MYNEVTENHAITVYDTTEYEGEKGRFRVLQFAEDAVQGAIDLNDPTRILFEYPRAMIHLMTVNRPAFANVFMIGHGIGTIPRHLPDKRFKIAELDRKLTEMSRRYFNSKTTDVHIGDGRLLLEQESSGAYSYIVLDAFTAEGTPPHLTTLQFFRLIRDKLDEEGGLLINLIAQGPRDKRACAAHTTLREVYAYVQAFALPIKGAAGLLNIVMMGRSKPIRFQLSEMTGFREIHLPPGELLVDESD
ncbi:spermidine synthase [Xylanibacillus composti]|nr:spermidine synthase [Xylanibacillus composti]